METGLSPPSKCGQVSGRRYCGAPREFSIPKTRLETNSLCLRLWFDDDDCESHFEFVFQGKGKARKDLTLIQQWKKALHKLIWQGL